VPRRELLGCGPARVRTRKWAIGHSATGPRAHYKSLMFFLFQKQNECYFDEFRLDFDLYSILHQCVYCLESRSVHNASELVNFKSCFYCYDYVYPLIKLEPTGIFNWRSRCICSS
jgi:hypothetical protein